jgi:putative RecB family exonuclease
MGLPLPTSLSPTKAAAFQECPFAFRRSVIDRVPTPPTPPLALGSITHSALERFYQLPAEDRTPAALEAACHEAWHQHERGGELAEFLTGLDDDARRRLHQRVISLARAVLVVEEPSRVHAIATELRLEARLEEVLIRGVIDRLDYLHDGDLVVVDYKTGRAPSTSYQDSRLGGVLTYALLLAETLGRAPRAVRLLYLADGCVIERTPSSRELNGVARRLAALWAAIERACEREDFPPRPSRLCASCPHREACPAMGAAA